MPWELLGLDPESATEREVKRAYAKKLKVTRPDKDPKGFQELKEARDEALLQLEYGGFISRKVDLDAVPLEEGTAGPSQADDWQNEYADFLDPVVEEREGDSLASQSIVSSTGRPSELLDSFLGLEAALESDEKIPEATREFESALYQNAHLAKEWGEMVAELLDSERGREAVKIKAEALLFELEHDSSAGAVAVITRAERANNRSGVGSLAGVLLENRSRISTGAGGEAMARLASACAIWEPLHVKPLSNYAYELLPTSWRDAALHQVDVDVHLGQLLRGLPGERRLFWLIRFRSSYEEFDWSSAEGEEALDFIRRKAPKDWQGFDAIASILPEELARTIPKVRAPQPLQHEPQQHYERQSSHSGGGGGVSGWLIFVVIFILLKVVVAVSQCDDGGYSDYHYAPPTLDRESLDKIIEDYNRSHPGDPVVLPKPGSGYFEGEHSAEELRDYLQKHGRLPPELRPNPPGSPPFNPNPDQPAIPGIPSPNAPIPSPFPGAPTPSPSRGPSIPGIP